jgi:very-short-patch-repair endonuclease
VDAAAALERLGGVGTTAAILELTSRRKLRKAIRRGLVVHDARGRHRLPTADEARARAHALTAVVGLRSAAAHHGWGLKTQPTVPEVIVKRGRKLTAKQREHVAVHWSNLADDQVEDGVTTPLRTILDCARLMPFDQALAIADSALRAGSVTREDLDSLDVRGAGSAAIRRVLRHANGLAANPFESVLRALCIEAGLEVEVQAEIDLGTGTVHPDLTCWALRLALEADSWTFHTKRQAHRRDCARYNLFILRDWRVLRFTWEQVMHDQSYVRWVLAELTGRVERPEAASDASHAA